MKYENPAAKQLEMSLGLYCVDELDRASLKAMLRIKPERIGQWIEDEPLWKERRIRILCQTLGITVGGKLMGNVG